MVALITILSSLTFPAKVPGGGLSNIRDRLNNGCR